MLQTMGGNPRNFNELDLYSLPSPCFVIDKKALRSNLEVLQKIKFETNVKVVIIITIIFLIIIDPIYYNEKQNKIRINQNYSLNVA